MPATPQVAPIAGHERQAEVDAQLDTEQPADATGDLGIAGEIVVDREHVDQQPGRQGGGRISAGLGQHLLRHRSQQGIGNHQLAHQTNRDQTHTLGQRLLVDHAGALQLGEEAARSLDRSRGELREPHQVQRKIDQPRSWRQLSAIHIQQIGDRLQQIERQPYRQQDRQGTHRYIPAQPRQQGQ